MSATFSVNFRRSSYEQGLARARRRVWLIGGGLAYAGALLILVGLFGLNCAMMARRADALERRAQRLEAARLEAPDLKLEPSDVERVQRLAGGARFWRDRLLRLAEILPPQACITSVVVNPDRSPAPAEQRRMVLAGTLRAPAEADRMQSVMRMVESLRSDSVFARAYGNVKLVSSRVPETDGPTVVEFVVECR